MPDTVIPVSPAAGSEPSPAAPIEPAGAGAPAPSVQQPATSGSSPAPGTQAPAAPQQTSPADSAFEAYLAEATTAAPDNREQTPAPAQPPPVAETPAPPEQPAAPEPPADPSDGAELEATLTPTADDQARGTVPVKNLSRALASRRKAIDQAKELESRLAKESQMVDRLIGTFQAAGVDAAALPVFLSNMARAKTDPQAKAAVLAHLGIQVPQPSPEPPKLAAPAPVDLAKLKQLVEGYDIAGALSLLESGTHPAPPPAAQPVQPAPTPPPVQAPQQVQPPPAQPPQPDPGEVQLRTQATAMIHTLRATFGQPEAVRLSKMIDEAATARINELQAYGIPIPTQAVAQVYLEAQGKVLQAEQQRRASPPSRSSPPVRPAPVAPPHKPTADEQFEVEFGRSR